MAQVPFPANSDISAIKRNNKITKLCKRPKKLPLDMAMNDDPQGNTITRLRPKKIENTDSVAKITLVVNEENSGIFYCSLVGTTILISREIDEKCKYVLSIVNGNLQRVDEQTVSITSSNKYFELKFDNKQSCIQFYNIVCSPRYAEIPQSESVCGYVQSDKYVISREMNRSKSFDFLQTEVQSPQYSYPCLHPFSGKKSPAYKKPNLPLGLLTSKPKLSDQCSSIYSALTQFVSPIYDYARVFPSPSTPNNHHLYESIVN